ncbi:hypothetical protein AA0117_g3964 [Alternaria alternata]|jgi:hypothetical protein|uniref:Uncharacterized protein n=1 Tax=Alternaria alternata TaxID=5599 RepID=A0A4Q4NNH3_ALTAL|nr:hypothetical protein AA0117_g3964 [Alternaria alternata]
MTTAARMDTFRFLDLPKEIRLIVYEQLPFIRRHSTLIMPYTPDHKGSIVLVLQVLPLAILRVSKMIHDEAYALLKPKMYELLYWPPRLIIPAPDIFKIGAGFAKFLQIARQLLHKQSITTLSSGEMVYYQPGMVYYAQGNIPLIITPSLIQWAQHAGLYLGQMKVHPILARFAADNPNPPMRSAGVQLLISQPGMGPKLCETCLEDHIPLMHILIYFMSENLSMARKKNPKVNVLLLGTSVCTPDAQNGLHYHGSENLQEELNSALWWNWPKCRLQKNGGHIVELAAWEGDWQATPTVGMLGISSDEEKTESATYIDFVQQHVASDGKRTSRHDTLPSY